MPRLRLICADAVVSREGQYPPGAPHCGSEYAQEEKKAVSIILTVRPYLDDYSGHPPWIVLSDALAHLLPLPRQRYRAVCAATVGRPRLHDRVVSRVRADTG